MTKIDKSLNRYWSITKIIAGVLNAIAIIGIAIWAQSNSNENTKLKNEMIVSIDELKVKQFDQEARIDSLKLIISDYSQITSQNFDQSFPTEIPQGTFIYELYFAEFGGRLTNAECKVIIKANEIKVEQTKNTKLTGEKIIFRGLILKHKSGKWILAESKEAANADEIGGCTEIPIIYFDQKLIEWC